MKKSEFKTQISNVLNHNNGREIDIAYLVVDILLSSGAYAPSLLQYFFEEAVSMFFSSQKSGRPKVTNKEVDELTSKYVDLVSKWMDDTLNNKPDEGTFYNSLWNYIIDKTLFETNKDKAVALFCVWMDPRIPYYKLEGKKMDIEDFKRIFDKEAKIRSMAKVVVFSKYDQRPEEASVLLDLLNKVKTKDEKSVLLAYILRAVELRTVEDISQKGKRGKKRKK